MLLVFNQRMLPERIAQADTEALQQWALNVLRAERLEAVFGRLTSAFTHSGGMLLGS